MSKLDQLNDLVLKKFTEYENLAVHDKKISTPYFMNNVGMWFAGLMEDEGVGQDKIRKVKKAFSNRRVPYGWYRGKGKPEEIAEAAEKISEKLGLPLKNASREVILEFMKLFGLGVDCSGLVYNLLSYGVRKLGDESLLDESLDWIDPSFRGVTRAGASCFTGKASVVVKPEDVRMLDIIFIKKKTESGSNHLGLVLKRNNCLVVVQSTIAVMPIGVNMSSLEIVDCKPVFGFKPEMGPSWRELFGIKRLEFRRLNCFKNYE
jgi:hypothetical protein